MMRLVTRFFLLSTGLLNLASCATYYVGNVRRGFPGGYDRVSVPMFKNKTLETGMETYFTTALIEEIERTKLAHVSEKEESQVLLEGEITRVDYVKGVREEIALVPNAPFGGESEAEGKAREDITAEQVKEYRIYVNVGLALIRRSDGKVLWTGSFDGERRYPTPQITLSGLNSANALYNQSARMQNMQLLARDMMVQAHSNLTENF